VRANCCRAHSAPDDKWYGRWSCWLLWRVVFLADCAKELKYPIGRLFFDIVNFRNKREICNKVSIERKFRYKPFVPLGPWWKVFKPGRNMGIFFEKFLNVLFTLWQPKDKIQICPLIDRLSEWFGIPFSASAGWMPQGNFIHLGKVDIILTPTSSRCARRGFPARSGRRWLVAAFHFVWCIFFAANATL